MSKPKTDLNLKKKGFELVFGLTVRENLTPPMAPICPVQYPVPTPPMSLICHVQCLQSILCNIQYPTPPMLSSAISRGTGLVQMLSCAISRGTGLVKE